MSGPYLVPAAAVPSSALEPDKAAEILPVGAGTGLGGQPGKRRRSKRDANVVKRACAECKARKVKCNEELPCSHCVRRRTACVYPAGRGRAAAIATVEATKRMDVIRHNRLLAEQRAMLAQRKAGKEGDAPAARAGPVAAGRQGAPGPGNLQEQRQRQQELQRQLEQQLRLQKQLEERERREQAQARGQQPQQEQEADANARPPDIIVPPNTLRFNNFGREAESDGAEVTPAVVPARHAFLVDAYARHVGNAVPFVDADRVARVRACIAGERVHELRGADLMTMFGLLAIGAAACGARELGRQYRKRAGMIQHRAESTPEWAAAFLLLVVDAKAMGLGAAAVDAHMQTALQLAINARVPLGRPLLSAIELMRLIGLCFTPPGVYVSEPDRFLAQQAILRLGAYERPDEAGGERAWRTEVVNEVLRAVCFSPLLGGNDLSAAAASDWHFSSDAALADDAFAKASSIDNDRAKISALLQKLRDARARVAAEYLARFPRWDPALDEECRKAYAACDRGAAERIARCADEPEQLGAAVDALTHVMVFRALEATVLNKCRNAPRAAQAADEAIAAVTAHPSVTLHAADPPAGCGDAPSLFVRLSPIAALMATQLLPIHQRVGHAAQAALDGRLIERLCGSWRFGGKVVIAAARSVQPAGAPRVARVELPADERREMLRCAELVMPAPHAGRLPPDEAAEMSPASMARAPDSPLSPEPEPELGAAVTPLAQQSPASSSVTTPLGGGVVPLGDSVTFPGASPIWNLSMDAETPVSLVPFHDDFRWPEDPDLSISDD